VAEESIDLSEARTLCLAYQSRVLAALKVRQRECVEGEPSEVLFGHRHHFGNARVGDERGDADQAKEVRAAC
jgi:hypothetical protein